MLFERENPFELQHFDVPNGLETDLCMIGEILWDVVYLYTSIYFYRSIKTITKALQLKEMMYVSNNRDTFNWFSRFRSNF